jgi:4'-phosphopantetheinyl transferase
MRAKLSGMHLPSSEVHVWLVRSAAGRELAEVARAKLRRLLAEQLGVDRETIRLGTGEHGKPELADPPGSGWLRFNISHSADLAAVALALGREVGVDVQRIDPARLGGRLPGYVLSPAELERYEALPPGARPRAFFLAWTAKEAHVKATGRGLGAGPRELEPAIAGDPGCLAAADDSSAGIGKWGLRELAVPQGYAGAVVAEGRDWRLVVH